MLTSAGPCDSPAVVKRSMYPPKKREPGIYAGLAIPASASFNPAGSRRDIGVQHVNDNEAVLRKSEQLHGHPGSRLGRCRVDRAERTAKRLLQLQLAAHPEEVRVDDLDLRLARGHERDAAAVGVIRGPIVLGVEDDSRS